MPRRFFRKFALKRDRFKGHWFLASFDHLLHDPNLWSIRRRTAVPAFAIGLFISYVPAPGHTIQAALVALALRVNIPIAVLTTFVSNPLTMGPMYYLAYRIGQELLGIEPQPFEFEMSLAWLQDQFSVIWQPLLLGCLIMGSLLAIVGYLTVEYLWRASLVDYLATRRRRRKRPD